MFKTRPNCYRSNARANEARGRVAHRCSGRGAVIDDQPVAPQTTTYKVNAATDGDHIVASVSGNCAAAAATIEDIYRCRPGKIQPGNPGVKLQHNAG